MNLGATNDVDEVLVAADRALHAGRAAAAEGLVDALAADPLVDAVGARGAQVRRARLIVGAARLADRDFAGASDHAATALEGARIAGDEEAETRALLLLGEISLRRGAPTIARERLTVVLARAVETGADFYAGRAAYLLAVLAMERDDFDAATGSLALALDRLGATEHGRYYAHALNVDGWRLSETGDDVAALARFDEADQIFARVGTPDDRLHVEANRARSLVLLGRAREAAQRYAPLVDAARRVGHRAEVPALHWLAVALFDLGRHVEAAAAADAMLSLAELVGAEGDRVAARIVGARARGDAASLEPYARGEGEVTEYQRAQAVLYLAEALAGTDPERASGLLAHARSLAIVVAAARLRVDLATVEGKLARSAIRTNGRALVVEPDLGAVTVKRAVDAVTRFLLADALVREGGDVSRAGARIGLSRTESYRLVKEFDLRT